MRSPTALVTWEMGFRGVLLQGEGAGDGYGSPSVLPASWGPKGQGGLPQRAPWPPMLRTAGPARPAPQTINGNFSFPTSSASRSVPKLTQGRSPGGQGLAGLSQGPLRDLGTLEFLGLGKRSSKQSGLELVLGNPNSLGVSQKGTPHSGDGGFYSGSSNPLLHLGLSFPT